MARPKRKLTAKEKAEKARLRQEYMWIFVGGKQKRVRRPPTFEGMNVDAFLLRNVDPLWLHQEGLWDLMPEVVALGEGSGASDEADGAGF